MSTNQEPGDIPDRTPRDATGGEPSDPIGKMLAGAIQVHELYVSYVDAGFSNEQALYLVGVIIAVAVRDVPPAT